MKNASKVYSIDESLYVNVREQIGNEIFVSTDGMVNYIIHHFILKSTFLASAMCIN